MERDFSKKVKKASRLALMFIIFLLLSVYSIKTLNDSKSSWQNRDYRQYWSSGKIFLEGKNPYDFELNNELQTPISNHTLITFIPPWAVFWLSPFSILPFRISVFFWFILNIAMLFVSGYLLWGLAAKFYVSNNLMIRTPVWAFILIGTFYPASYALKAGQACMFLLLGVSLFLYFRTKGNFFLAGIFLSMLLIKPHLFFLIWTGLFYEFIWQKRMGSILGVILVLTLSISIILLINPTIFKDYLNYVRRPTYVWYENVSIGGFLSSVGYKEDFIGAPAKTVAFIPAFVACIFFIIYLIRTKEFSLDKNLPTILSLSIFTTPYGWVTDQSLLLLPYLIIYNFLIKIYANHIFLFVTLGLAINGALGFFHSIGMIPEYMFFPAPLFFVFIIYLFRISKFYKF